MKTHSFRVCVARALFFAMPLFLFSCTKNQDVPAVEKDKSIDVLVNYLAEQGFSKDKIVLKNDQFIIDGDILISKAEVEARLAKDALSPRAPGEEHWRSSVIVSRANVTNIKVFMDANVPEAWKVAVRGAVANWNSISGSIARFSVVSTQTQANTRVFMGNDAAGTWVARAYLPGSGGTAGVSTEINAKYNSMSASQKLFAITHEFGHTIGFYHTNQTTGVFISGTPSVDANSVMNSFVLNWNGFTSGDITATRILYPL